MLSPPLIIVTFIAGDEGWMGPRGVPVGMGRLAVSGSSV